MAKTEPQLAILDAANRILTRQGLAGATVEAIAAEAGMSKGGVLHYFPSKEKLLAGAVQRQVDHIFRRRDEILATLPKHPCNLARATMTAMLEYRNNIKEEVPSGIGVLGEQIYRDIIGDMKKRMFKEMAKVAKHPEKVAIIMYIIDGAWINMLFRPHSPSKKIEAKAMRIITGLIDECCQ